MYAAPFWGPAELLSHVCKTVAELKIPYIVTGSIATIAYGAPRLTNDIDIAGVLKIMEPETARKYLTVLARRLGLSNLWREVNKPPISEHQQRSRPSCVTAAQIELGSPDFHLPAVDRLPRGPSHRLPSSDQGIGRRNIVLIAHRSRGGLQQDVNTMCCRKRAFQ